MKIFLMSLIIIFSLPLLAEDGPDIDYVCQGKCVDPTGIVDTSTPAAGLGTYLSDAITDLKLFCRSVTNRKGMSFGLSPGTRFGEICHKEFLSKTPIICEQICSYNGHFLNTSFKTAGVGNSYGLAFKDLASSCSSQKDNEGNSARITGDIDFKDICHPVSSFSLK